MVMRGGAPILPGAVIGVVGGGQLGRMLALEARRMGYRTLVMDPDPDGPAAQIADAAIEAPLDDVDAALELARRSDVVTLEWENADADTVRAMEEGVPVRPGAHVLEVAQHRLREKESVRRLGLGTAEFRAVRTRAELRSALESLGTPAILKTVRGGYDGKGQSLIREAAEADAAFAELGSGAKELILEQFVPFRMEASVICARSPRGEVAAFPIVENRHRNGILDLTLAPADLPPSVLEEARRVGEALVEGLDVVGLLAAELFITGDDGVLVNELAPRPHNSGHYTWEACSVSQFEQQLRAVCDLPLARPELLRPAAMANLLGEDAGTGEGNDGIAAALSVPHVSLHLYGKREARAGRKMGHLTALGSDAGEALERVTRARDLLRGGEAEAGEPRGR
jgi:5-(carboxyamino)imidazole ribonucleotide synthase